MRRAIGDSVRILLVTALLLFGAVQAGSAQTLKGVGTTPALTPEIKSKMEALKRQMDLPAQREAAAARRNLMANVSGLFSTQSPLSSFTAKAVIAPPGPGSQPDYFGFTPNWAFSPLIRKFVDTLPGLGSGAANNLGNYIPVAKPDTITYPGSDYYEIELRQYTQKMHSDLPATTLRGYVQVNSGTDATGHNTLAPDPIHYLGPIIQATKDRPVRIKFTNKLPTGAGGDLFLPVDTTVMGAGMGPDGMSMYKENRGTIHLHGGRTVWISDGTPYQWTTPAGEDTPYPKGVSVKNVPDMPDPGDGSMTFFYSNQQSARMLWFHDHAYGITRLNVYTGEASGYMLTDSTEKRLIADGVIPADQIPLIIQDKTFVDASTIATTDPTWNWGTTAPVPHTGDLWFPHVYMPNQNPYDVTGTNTMGRWDYGPWFFPPTTDIPYPPIPNPYYDPINAPWEPPVMPAVPATSSVMEAFMDTPMVNGTPYPTVTLQPKSYRFRILNAANDRTLNLQMYTADPSTTSSDGRKLTEVKMVPAAPTTGFPASWPVDGRDGGVPDPATVGPDFIQIGNEGGFLPAPTIVKNQPVDWNLNMKTFTFGNVSSKALALAPAERADVVVDFSKYAGKTIILYNDAPAAWPARDPRNDYFTGAADQTDTGGTKGALAGFGPNTRTIMQIKIAKGKPGAAFNFATLKAAFETTGTHVGVFKASQDPVLVAQAPYSSAYATSFPSIWPYWGYSAIQDTSLTFMTSAGTTMTLDMKPKGIHDEMGGAYDEYGRMMGLLGVEVPTGNAVTQQFIGQTYTDPSTENIVDSITPMSPVAGDGTQIWKITQNGVDTHPIHFHLFDVQLLNRVGWDGMIETPDPNELGWKETVRVNPLQDTIVALRPAAPKPPWGVPDSIRALDPTQPIGGMMGFSNRDPITGDPITTINEIVNFGWEYMWHCHILSHEEMAMMRPISFEVARSLPATPVVAATGVPGGSVGLVWIDATPPNDPASWGNPASEIGFRVIRTTVDALGAELAPYSSVATELANATAYRDYTTVPGTAYAYKVVAFNAAGETTSTPVRVGPSGFFAENIITPWASLGGTVTPSAATTVASGTDSPAFTLTADPSFHQLNAAIDGVSIGTSSSVTFTNVLLDHQLWGFFVPDTLAITPSVASGGVAVAAKAAGVKAATVVPGGTITPDVTTNVPYGADQTFTFTPDPGYHVDDVVVDGVSVGRVSSYTFYNVTVPHTISVSFAIDTFLISPTAWGPGTISPDTLETVQYGGSDSFTIAPNAGSRIIDVKVDGVSMGPITSYTFTNVTAPHTIDVSFGMPVYRFYNLKKGVHFYTASEAEKNDVIARLSGTYRFEGVAYSVNTDDPDNSTPLYRFYNFKKGVHFYTASEAEKNAVVASLSSTFRLEGVAYSVCATAVPDAVPVYRFYNVKKGVHFYTASEGEKNAVLATLASTFRLEGIGFYLAP